MAHQNNEQNLIPMSERTPEEVREIARKGGLASAEARRNKATMKKTLEQLLETKSSKGKTYRELATLGLIKGAISGKAECYKTILEVIGELEDKAETPSIEIRVVDNSNLESIMYEEKDL